MSRRNRPFQLRSLIRRRGWDRSGFFTPCIRKLFPFNLERPTDVPKNGSMETSRACAFLVLSLKIAAAAPPQAISSVFDSALASQPAQASSTPLSYVIAHFPYGGGWSTRLMLANNGSATAKVNITFLDQLGRPAFVPLEGEGPQSSQQLSIPPNQVKVVGADPAHRTTGDLQVAWGTASSSAPLNIFTLFDTGPSAAVITGAVGAPSTAAARSFRFPVSVNGPLGYNAGMAIANPNSSAATVTVKVLNTDGSVKGSFQEILQANHQTLFVLTQKMTFDAALFSGSVAVCGTQPVGLVTVGFEGGQAFFTTSVTNDPCP